jgi:outer membrane phospholipase A
MKKLMLILALALPVAAFAVDEKKEEPKSEGFIQPHRSVFMLVGDNSMNTLLQVSLKYELWRNSNLYLGYTQLSMWQLFYPSSPFRDHNFNPEIFYRFTHLQKYDFTADVGQEHKSNGRESGPDDRTMDSTYVSAEKGFTIGGVRVGFANKLYAVYRTFGNESLKDYLGYWKTGLTIGFDVPWLENEQLFANFIPGISSDLSKSTLEAGARFRTPFGQDFSPYFMVQYWRGYTAMLLDYDKFSEGFRVGIVLIP